MIKAGDCFLLETNYSKDGYIDRHLLIVVLDPEEFTNNTIVIPVDTLRSQKHDQTTILTPDDHEFIKDKSYVNYSLAKIRPTSFIDSLVKGGKGKEKEPIGSDVLERVIGGIRKSDHTPREVLTMYSYYMMRKIPKK